MMSVSMGCGDLWSPFLAYREEAGLVLIPNGRFMMGSPATEPDRNSANEAPHPVSLTTDYWMAESEVTQRQYRNVMGSSPSNFKGDDLPVENVSWLDAVTYCNALSEKENLPPCYQISGETVGWADGVKCKGYRLPTEAEWEYAANPASGLRTVYAGSNSPDAVAWYDGNAGSKTHAVKTKAANGRGLYDLSGNVWEWVWDCYQENYEVLPSINPTGAAMNSNRVTRGGSWIDSATFVRVGQRNHDKPASLNKLLGFRIVRSNP
ncbi:MAG: formylglycine-generating enzyme family protein [Myxococcales bacterium]|nr:formylglycine-generating enzyme family protein [Myxococcales bacterium]